MKDLDIYINFLILTSILNRSTDLLFVQYIQNYRIK